MKNESTSMCQNWHITLGDLLTLLLCMFISLIVHQPKFVASNAKEVQEVKGKKEDSMESASRGGSQSNSGTQIAKIKPDRQIFISKKHFIDLAKWEELEHLAQRRIAEWGADTESIEVLACSPMVGGIKDQESWFLSLGRVLKLRGVIERQANAKSLKVETGALGPNCNAFQLENEDAVAKITFRLLAD